MYTNTLETDTKRLLSLVLNTKRQYFISNPIRGNVKLIRCYYDVMKYSSTLKMSHYDTGSMTDFQAANESTHPKNGYVCLMWTSL